MRKQMVLKIYGKVQGVFFRDFVKEKARDLNLSGWVSNEPNKTVKIVAEGEEDNLKGLYEFCKKGPTYADVKRVEIEWLESIDKFEDFEVR